MRRFVAVVILALGIKASALATEPTLVVLTEAGAMVVLRADRPGVVRTLVPVGLRGRLIGVDTRPADGHLYGLTDGSDVYRIDPATGKCVLVSTLTTPFDGGVRSGIDFNPQADRLRLVSSEGRNLRVNVDLGATAVDTAIAYAAGDPGAGSRPRITAAAYTNAVAGAPETKLLEIDAGRDVLVVQDPPNDGVLRTVGPLGVDFGPTGGFDIVTDGGVNRGWAASGSELYAVDLGSGRATVLGRIGDGGASVISLAATREAEAP
jgi:hypothetical protein